MGIEQLVRIYSRRIQNGRTLSDIVRHAEDELVELKDELVKLEAGEPQGDDGIVGESIDVILCALDAIYVANPAITDEEILDIARTKCEKWARLYSNSPDGNR